MIKQCVICLSLLGFSTAAAQAEEGPLVTARHMSKWEELAVKEAKKGTRSHRYWLNKKFGTAKGKTKL